MGWELRFGCRILSRDRRSTNQMHLTLNQYLVTTLFKQEPESFQSRVEGGRISCISSEISSDRSLRDFCFSLFFFWRFFDQRPKGP